MTLTSNFNLDEKEELDEKPIEIVPEPTSSGMDLTSLTARNNLSEAREKMLKDYYGGEASFVRRLISLNKTSPEDFINALIVEMVNEADNLLGNELVATQDGDIRVSSVIATKRTEVLERAAKAVQKKQETDAQNRVDLDSPVMRLVLQLVMEKINDVFVSMNLASEQRDVFFRLLPEKMRTWKTEVQRKLEDIATAEVAARGNGKKNKR